MTCFKYPLKVTAYFFLIVGLVVLVQLILFFIQQSYLQGNGVGIIWGLFAILNDLHLMVVQYFKIRDDAEYFCKEKNFRLVVYSGFTIFVTALAAGISFTVRFSKGELDVDVEDIGFIFVGVFLGLCGICQSLTFWRYSNDYIIRQKRQPCKVSLDSPDDEYVEAAI